MEILFNPSERSSLGIEVELAIVDRGSRQLRSGASEILKRLENERGEPHPRAKNELIESNIELITGICSTAAEARSDLEGTLAEVAPVAEELGLALLCAGTHPFSDWAAQDITPNERYLRLVDEVQWPARRMAIFGIHTHVGVRSAEKAIAIANALTGYIPHFLALSASSPWIVGQNKWRAARHGVDAEIIIDERGTLAPLRGAIADLVEELMPVARRLGCEKEIDHARRILEYGPSYLRQRRWVAAGATLVDVVDGLIGELRSDQPG